MGGAGKSGFDVTCAVGRVRGRSSSRFVVGSIGGLTQFAFRTNPIVKSRSGFAAASFVKLIGATANCVLGDFCRGPRPILSGGWANCIKALAWFGGHD